MDVSHITNILSGLGKNQVTSPIKENDFQENRVAEYYSKIITNDIYKGLDDICFITNRYKPKKSQQKISIHTNKMNKTNLLEHKTNHVKSNDDCYNLVYALACIRNTMLTLEKRQSKIVEVFNHFIQDMKNFVGQNTCKMLHIDTINNEKVSKNMLLDTLDISFENELNPQQVETIMKVASRMLSLNLAIIDTTDKVVCMVYLPTNTNHDEYLVIYGTKKGYMLGDSVQKDQLNNKCIKQKLTELKQQDNFQENLKNQSVKDLRNIAKDIGIDTVDTHTGKLYTKNDLKQLIEAQLKTII